MRPFQAQRASQGLFRSPTLYVGTGAPAVDFAANWSNFGFGVQTLHYWQDEQGVAYLQGAIKRSGTAALNEPIITLPEELRPALNETHLFGALFVGNVIRGFQVNNAGVLSPQFAGTCALAVMDTFWIPGHERIS